MDGRKVMLLEIQRSDRGRGGGDREHLASRGIGSEARPSLIVPRSFCRSPFCRSPFSLRVYFNLARQCVLCGHAPLLIVFPIFSGCFSLSSSLCVFQPCSANKVYVWSLQTGKLLDVLAGHEAPLSELSFSPNQGVLASASWDGTVKLWDVFKSECIEVRS